MPWKCSACDRKNADNREDCWNCGRWPSDPGATSSDSDRGRGFYSGDGPVITEGHRRVFKWAISAIVFGTLFLLSAIVSIATLGTFDMTALGALLRALVALTFIVGGILVLAGQSLGRDILRVVGYTAIVLNVIAYIFNTISLANVKITPQDIARMQTSYPQTVYIPALQLQDILRNVELIIQLALVFGLAIQIAYCVGQIRAMALEVVREPEEPQLDWI